MTIVVAGYESEPGESKTVLLRALEVEDSLASDAHIKEYERRCDYADRLMRPKRAFVVSDSLLSRKGPFGRDAVADSAQKITPVELVLSIPEFAPHGRSAGTVREYRRFSCGVAFSGTTAMQTLTLDKFRSLASHLRYTWVPGLGIATGHYAICQDGSSEDLLHASNAQIEYGDDIDFAWKELPPLEAEQVLQTFLSAFQASLDDYAAKEGRLGPTRGADVAADFVLLTYCEREAKPVIYEIGFESDGTTIPPTCFRPTSAELEWDELAVLGMPSMAGRLQQVRQRAIDHARSITDAAEDEVFQIVMAERQKNYVGGPVCRGVLSDRGFTIER